MLDLALIESSRAFLRGRIRKTPLEPSPALARILGVPTWLKLEHLQTTGSFKIRGALFRLSRLTESERAAGIVTCSAGNHGKAIAFAARELNVGVEIHVPANVDQAKHQAMLALGATVIRSSFFGYDDTEKLAREEATKAKLPFISAFDDEAIMAGNGGSLAAEILEDLPETRNFIMPVGGGGLSAGASFYLKHQRPGCHIIGCQHRESPALRLSLDKGEAVTSLPALKTLAAGIEGGLGALCFKFLKERIDRVALVSESEILAGVRWMLDQHQYLIEPSAAAAPAACLHNRVGELRGPTVVVLSGRNVSMSTLKEIVCSTSPTERPTELDKAAH